MLGHILIIDLRGLKVRLLPAEVPLELLLILLLETLHVLGHVEPEDVLSVNVSVELLALRVVAREAFLGVGNVESSVNGTLQGSEHLHKCYELDL